MKMINPRLLEIAERQANEGIPKPREKPKQSKLIQILERDENGKPIIELTPMVRTAINTPTQKSYNSLMRVYECGGWRWYGGKLPAEEDFWWMYLEETCVHVKDQFIHYPKSYILSKGHNIIFPQEFYDTQKITSEILNEINNWFDKNEK